MSYIELVVYMLCLLNNAAYQIFFVVPIVRVEQHSLSDIQLVVYVVLVE